MPSLLRPRNLYVALTYLLLSSMPFAQGLFGRPVEHAGQMLGLEVLCWTGAWGLFKRPAWFHWMLLPAFVALPVELYLQVFYGQGISTHHLGIIAETSPVEAMEFLGRKVWLLLATAIGVLAWFVTSWVAASRTRDLDWTDISRWVVLAVLGLGAGVFAYGIEFGVAAPVLPSAPSATAGPPRPGSIPRRGALPPLVHWARLPFDLDTFAHSWPFGLMARGVDFYKERVYLADLNRRSARFHFGAHAALPGDEPQLVVMVIGESSRYDRWSLNGYARETNPLLAQEPNVVTLADVVTSVSATRLSVPVIISRKPATESLKDGFS
jgi:glucan phosphoethanolaminetransferase (alkaline phosphatase superfamily)